LDATSNDLTQFGEDLRATTTHFVEAATPDGIALDSPHRWPILLANYYNATLLSSAAIWRIRRISNGRNKALLAGANLLKDTVIGAVT
jgi:hypothetical protein